MVFNIKDHWSVYELEFYRNQSKIKIIKGWNELFATCEEDIQNLDSLKMS